MTPSGVSQTLLDCLVTNKNDPALVAALTISNARLRKGAGDLRMPLNFFTSSPKAATMLHFIIFHSAHIMYGILPDRHFELWLSFVKCCRIFFAHELTHDLIDEVELRYEQFVRDFIDLFPAKNIPFNMHISLHIAENLRVFGPSFTSWW